MLRLINICLFTLLLGSCKQSTESPDLIDLGQEPPRSPIENNIKAHRSFLDREVKSIKDYIAERDLDLQRNGTGIHYKINDEKGSGPLAQSGDLVFYTYSIAMLNGSELYKSPENKRASLLLDRQDAEIGLHDALKLLRLGDKGFFILPSHRAFGVAGDQNKVPPFTALVYELEIVQIQKQKQKQ
jgi:FKBP-type peptidyl-prolyl cis-trans isomerase FkpA